jgi:hypothetical protein
MKVATYKVVLGAVAALGAADFLISPAGRLGSKLDSSVQPGPDYQRQEQYMQGILLLRAHSADPKNHSLENALDKLIGSAPETISP